MKEPQSRSVSPENCRGAFPQDQNEDEKGEGKEDLQNQDGLKVLPFEFVALEACLEAACSCLDSEVSYLIAVLVTFSFFCYVYFVFICSPFVCVSQPGKNIGA